MKDYIQKALKTESKNCDLKGKERLLHAGMGLCTESAEFLDALKKNILYGKPLDKVNLKEEIGDILWYIALALDELGTDFETEMKRNIKKLESRYKKKAFEKENAIERNLKKEREVLGE